MIIKKHYIKFHQNKLIVLVEIFDKKGKFLAAYHVDSESDEAGAVLNFLDLALENGIIDPQSITIKELEFKRKKKTNG